MKKNIVFGSSGLVGSTFYNLLKKNKNFIFYSKSDPKFKILDLNSDLKKFPYKDIDRCYFFSSPRILKKNFSNGSFKSELDWVKKIILNIKMNKLIYISSSSVYYKKGHVIGINKIKCENYIIKNKDQFKNYQIWRPFNLIGDKYVNSDHFHNHLFKEMFLKRKKRFIFSGNLLDKRGYADVKHFVKIMYKNSNLPGNFLRDYGNSDSISVSAIVNLYNKYYKKINKCKFDAVFKSKKININVVKSKKNTIFYKIKSLTVLKKYLTKSLYEKKM